MKTADSGVRRATVVVGTSPISRVLLPLGVAALPAVLAVAVVGEEDLEFAEDADPKQVMKKVLKACKKVEPDCEIEL